MNIWLITSMSYNNKKYIGELAEWSTDLPGANQNSEQSELAPRLRWGEIQDVFRNAAIRRLRQGDLDDYQHVLQQ